MQISLDTKEEAQALINLLDMAVKAGGFQAAEAAVYFAKKIEAAQKAEMELQAQHANFIKQVPSEETKPAQ